MPDAVEARFVCCEKTEAEHTEGTLKFRAVTDADGDWEQFTKHTPSGSIEVGVDSDAPAFDFFDVGETYALTFEPVEGG